MIYLTNLAEPTPIIHPQPLGDIIITAAVMAKWLAWQTAVQTTRVRF